MWFCTVFPMSFCNWFQLTKMTRFSQSVTQVFSYQLAYLSAQWYTSMEWHGSNRRCLEKNSDETSMSTIVMLLRSNVLETDTKINYRLSMWNSWSKAPDNPVKTSSPWWRWTPNWSTVCVSVPFRESSRNTRDIKYILSTRPHVGNLGELTPTLLESICLFLNRIGNGGSILLGELAHCPPVMIQLSTSLLGHLLPSVQIGETGFPILQSFLKFVVLLSFLVQGLQSLTNEIIQDVVGKWLYVLILFGFW